MGLSAKEMVDGYGFQTVPYAHQREGLLRSAPLKYYALLMDQGTGKSKIIIDNAAMLYNLGHINALVVIAPNGVHRNWIRNEIPAHLPSYIPVRCAYWASDPRAKEKKAQAAIWLPSSSLKVYSFNVEALSHKRAFDEIKRFLTCTNALLVLDESQSIKNHSSQRTKNILKLKILSKARRIATGTPITETPMEAWTQFEFLSPSILNQSSYVAFRARYAELEDETSALMKHIKEKAQQKNPTKKRIFLPAMIKTDHQGKPIYRNLDELRRLIEPHSYRVLKEDCLDLPPKVYTRHPVDLSKEQEIVYKSLIARLNEEFVESGMLFFKPVSKLTAVMYLQQILSGIHPAVMFEDLQPRQLFKKPQDNPRIAALLGEAEGANPREQFIIWGRFTYDIKQICEALRNEYGDDSVVEYYGEVRADVRERAITRFQAGQARFFVGSQKAGGTGLTLTAASQVHYYSNSFSLVDRLQSEDRAHRIGQTKSVRYVDYEVEGTIDTKILRAFVNKKDVADMITGDAFREWISL